MMAAAYNGCLDRKGEPVAAGRYPVCNGKLTERSHEGLTQNFRNKSDCIMKGNYFS
jgi:hypothetical protein